MSNSDTPFTTLYRATGHVFSLTCWCLLALLTLPAAGVRAQTAGQTTIGVTSITIPTHVVDNALVYQTNSTYNIPYAQLNRSKYNAGRVENRVYNLIILENNYLKVTLLPELGGRIYQVIFKPTGNNMLYQNPVLKPSPWGPPEMGWWLAAGGIEWCLPVEEHGYEWGIPWQYQLTDLPDGAKIEVWDTTASNRLRAKIAITLPDNAAFFQVTPTLENPTAQPIDYKFWLNAMLAPGAANQVSDNLRFVMSTSQVTVHSTGDTRLPGPGGAANWPTHNGVDWSRLGNWRQWYGFFQRPRAAGDFQAVYDEAADEGTVRIYPNAVAQGAKFFGFGYGPQALSPDLYTDGTSSYVEMHGGVAPTFADSHRLNAHSSITWDEQWYPVAGLGGLTWANQHLALYLAASGADTRLHVAVTQAIVKVRILALRQATNEVLFQEQLSTLTPGQPYHALVLPNISPNAVAVLVYQDNTLLGAYQYNGGQIIIPTITPVDTPTPSPSFTPTLKPASSPTSSPTSTPTNTATSTMAPTATPTPSPTMLPTATFTPLPTFTATSTPPPTATPPPTSTATPTILPTSTLTPTPTPSPLPISISTWQGRVKQTTLIGGGASIARIWVNGKTGLPVTIKSRNPRWVWQATAYSGSKPEYGPDALEFAPLPPFSYTLTVPDLPARFDFTLPAGAITEIIFEQKNLTATPSPAATPTPTATPDAATPTATFTPTAPTPVPTPTPASSWHVRIPSNTTVSGNWFAIIRVSVEGKARLPVWIKILDDNPKPWTTTCLTGSKPEYGPYFCEFSPLIPGQYLIWPEGLGISTLVEVKRSGIAVVIFEQY